MVLYRAIKVVKIIGITLVGCCLATINERKSVILTNLYNAHVLSSSNV